MVTNWVDRRLAADDHVFLNHDRLPFSPEQERGLWRAYSGLAALAVQFNGAIIFDDPIGFSIIADSQCAATEIAKAMSSRVSLRQGTTDMYDLEDVGW